MKRKLFTINRIVIIAISLLVQIVWLFIMLYSFKSYSALLSDIMLILSLIALLFIAGTGQCREASYFFSESREICTHRLPCYQGAKDGECERSASSVEKPL